MVPIARSKLLRGTCFSIGSLQERDIMAVPTAT